MTTIFFNLGPTDAIHGCNLSVGRKRQSRTKEVKDCPVLSLLFIPFINRERETRCGHIIPFYDSLIFIISPLFFYFYSHHLFYTTECNNKAMCVLPLPLAVPARTHPVTTLLSAPSFISFEKKERRRKKNECFAAVAVAAMPPGGRVAS